ncbi:MAG: hemolysin III family protein [Patescibacteria group bacterium]
MKDIINPFHLNNEPISALTHLIGLALAMIAMIVMVILAILKGTAMHFVGFSIFGLSLVLLYTSSFFYHILPQDTKVKEISQRIDHAMIFFLIAGSYTPICLTIDNRKAGWTLLITIWSISIVGMIIKSIGIKIKSWKSTIIYILLGLLMLTAIYPLREWLSAPAMLWLFGGGSLYIIGAIFYIWEDYMPRRYRFDMHEIWHIFVMLGSFSHVYLMIIYILYL